MFDQEELDKLVEIIAISRYPAEPNTFVPAEKIAEDVIRAGYIRIEDRITVSRAMLEKAILAYFPGVLGLSEISDLARVEERMAGAIYAALDMWRAQKFQTSKDHAQRQ